MRLMHMNRKKLVGQALSPAVCAGNSRAGVTLIEMLVVVTIIALFAAIVGPRLLHRGDQARVVAAKQEISNIQLALGQYKLDTGVFPTQELGLAALRQQPSGM